MPPRVVLTLTFRGSYSELKKILILFKYAALDFTDLCHP